MLASSKTMRDILSNHLVDVQSMGPDRKPWRFNGPWEIYGKFFFKPKNLLFFLKILNLFINILNLFINSLLYPLRSFGMWL